MSLLCRSSLCCSVPVCVAFSTSSGPAPRSPWPCLSLSTSPLWPSLRWVMATSPQTSGWVSSSWSSWSASLLPSFQDRSVLLFLWHIYSVIYFSSLSSLPLGMLINASYHFYQDMVYLCGLFKVYGKSCQVFPLTSMLCVFSVRNKTFDWCDDGLQIEGIGSIWVERKKSGGEYNSRQARKNHHVVVCAQNLAGDAIMDFLTEFFSCPKHEVRSSSSINIDIKLV